MPGSAEFVQRMVHAVEAGAASVWLRRLLAAIVICGVAVIFLFNFRGLATAQAMDQAQIGRALARGQGFHTNYVRPAAIGQLQAHHKDVPTHVWQDTYNAPLPIVANAIALFPFKSHLAPNPKAPVYVGDRVLAGLGLIFFFAALGLQFLIAWRLFDRWLALVACTLILVCNMMWQYAISGLPQMLLLFLFNATVYALVRAVQARQAQTNPIRWLAAVGVGFGLLALAHGLTIWIFVPALILIGFFFQPRVRCTGIVLGIFALLYLPWLIRNWIVCGNPAGMAFYAILDGLGQAETSWIRDIAPSLAGVGPTALRDKMLGNILADTGRLFDYLGWSVVALMFFAALLHRFRRPETNILRWMLLAMWVGAVAGMGLFGLPEEQGFSANQLHLLFVPVMTCYGLAWLLVQWNRLNIQFPFARSGFIALLFLLCGLPLVNSLLGMLFGFPTFPTRWPPYIPPYLAVLNQWMQPNEATASDIPWAVAWYGDRPSILVPASVKTLTDISDYGVIGVTVPALYLTPVSGADNKWRDISKGQYKEWAAVIQQNTDLGKLPYKWGTLVLGPNGECPFLADRDRSKKAEP